MGQKDLTEKNLESFSDVFTDIVNALMYDGDIVIKEEDLIPAPTETIYGGGNGELNNQFQDVGMYVVSNDRIISRYMLENQTGTDKRMVLRKAGYEGAVYRKQYESREIYPVVGAVLYWGKGRWNSPLNLKALFREEDCINLPDKYIDDVQLHVYEMAHLTKEERERFHSDMRIVVDYLAEGEKYIPTEQRISHPEALLRMLKAITNDVRYEQIIPQIKNKEDVKMCELIDRYEKMGIDRARTGDIKSLMKNLKLSLEKAMDALDIAVDEREYYGKLIDASK